MLEESEIYGAVGGEAPFFSLVEAFYRGVETDQALRSLYPADLEPGKRHLAWFLIQRFGGPELFNQRRGAPRLGMRHAAFSIPMSMRNAWLAHMLAAVDDVAEFAPFKETLGQYFDQTATFLINREELSPCRTRLEGT